MLAVSSLLGGCLCHLASAGLALATGLRFQRLVLVLAVMGSLGLALAGLVALAGVPVELLQWTWPAGPSAGIVIAVDALSGAFLLPLALLSAVAAIYAAGYWDGQASGRSTRLAMTLLVVGMALVLSARQGFWFLVVWELMALAAWWAMSAEHRQAEVRRSGWIYLAFTHLGTGCLLVMVLLLSQGGRSLLWTVQAGHPATAAILLLALAGFGAKAGLFPLHGWLPGAHAGAPSHISALLSGMMLKTGIYGLLRVAWMVGPVPAWWGMVLVLVGAVTALYGIASALTQADAKRLLACSSIEHLGLITLAIGLAVLAQDAHRPELALVALGGALLHVWHHAVFKGLLFLGAGAVLHATGTRSLDRLGGLLQRMPTTGGLTLLGCGAAAGLPGLAAFASEWPLYLTGFGLLRTTSGWAGLLTVITLALCGGLALAAYAKWFGTVFLGAGRSPATAHAHDPTASMRWTMLVLAGLSVLLAALFPWSLLLLQPAVHAAGGWSGSVVPASAWWLAGMTAVAWGVFVLLWLGLRRVLARHRPGTAVTWDCGYAEPTARMQYTARSFTGVLGGELAPPLIRPSATVERATGLFPGLARLTVRAGDGLLDRVIRPAVEGASRLCLRLRLLQQGHLAMYLLYILVTVVVLLAVALMGIGKG